MDIKRDVKTSLNAKSVRIEDDLIIDENGATVDIIKIAKVLFGTGEFKLTLTASESSEIDVDSDEE